MARISGVDIPREKRLEISLTYIFGIGKTRSKEICDGVGISRDTRVRDLTEEEVSKLREHIDTNFQVEGDLRAGILRHVSEAFAEDPVRILRLARFAARFEGFQVAPETLALMRRMVADGEVEPEPEPEEFAEAEIVEQGSGAGPVLPRHRRILARVDALRSTRRALVRPLFRARIEWRARSWP